MANINISDIRPAGADLFNDPESFMVELTSDENLQVHGGGGKLICCGYTCTHTVAALDNAVLALAE